MTSLTFIGMTIIMISYIFLNIVVFNLYKKVVFLYNLINFNNELMDRLIECFEKQKKD